MTGCRAARLRVLLLNPPGERLYVRDYYCSKVAKSGYVVHPVDLLVLSGRIAERHEVRLIDAVAEQLDHSACRARVGAFSPDVIIAVSGAVSRDEDRLFLSSLRGQGRRILVSGDVVLDDPVQWLRENDFADAAVIDFTGEDILSYLEERDDLHPSVVTRQGGAPAGQRPVNREFTLPVPRHELFLSRRYRFPFSRHRLFATVLTDYGCPFSCSFCVMSTIGYQYRPVENVLAELRHLRGLGVRELYFSDQTFGAIRQRALDLCGRMRDEEFGFGWTCFSRADILSDARFLDALRAAGCHTAMLGVESASPSVLATYGKGCTHDQIRRALSLCRERGIRTVATFILGLPEETEDTARATIELAKTLDCDYASFNVAVPRMGTPLRREAIRTCLIAPEVTTMDQSGSNIVMPSKFLAIERLASLRVRAIREYYLRPRYLWRRLKSVTTFSELREHLAEGWELIRSLRDAGGRRPER